MGGLRGTRTKVALAALLSRRHGYTGPLPGWALQHPHPHAAIRTTFIPPPPISHGDPSPQSSGDSTASFHSASDAGRLGYDVLLLSCPVYNSVGAHVSAS
jgi:hypothetical protein